LASGHKAVEEAERKARPALIVQLPKSSEQWPARYSVTTGKKK
jgi:hypothetical protein